MDSLNQLSELLKKRNMLEEEITALIGRPAAIGHIGEYIASKIFKISLQESASYKSLDGRFAEGPLSGRSVNIKWYALREGLLDITPEAFPDEYLVFTGPKATAMNSKGRTRPWLITAAFLFEASDLVTQLQAKSLKVGVASSVAHEHWAIAEIYPTQRNTRLIVTDEQRQQLALFE